MGTVTRLDPGASQPSSSRKTLPDSVTITRVPAQSPPVFQQFQNFQPVAVAPVQQLDCVKLQKDDIERRRAEARRSCTVQDLVKIWVLRPLVIIKAAKESLRIE